MATTSSCDYQYRLSTFTVCARTANSNNPILVQACDTISGRPAIRRPPTRVLGWTIMHLRICILASALLAAADGKASAAMGVPKPSSCIRQCLGYLVKKFVMGCAWSTDSLALFLPEPAFFAAGICSACSFPSTRAAAVLARLSASLHTAG